MPVSSKQVALAGALVVVTVLCLRPTSSRSCEKLKAEVELQLADALQRVGKLERLLQVANKKSGACKSSPGSGSGSAGVANTKEHESANVSGPLLADYVLPPIQNVKHKVPACDKVLDNSVRVTQVFRNAQLLDVTLETGEQAWLARPQKEAAVASWVTALHESASRKTVEATGIVQTSQLLPLLGSGVRVVFPRDAGILEMDVPIVIEGQQDITIDFSNTRINVHNDKDVAYWIRIKDSTGITIQNGRFKSWLFPTGSFLEQDGVGLSSFLLIAHSKQISVSGNRIENIPQAAIAVMHSSAFFISRNHVMRSGAGGILIMGGCRDGLIADNEVSDCAGYANHHAGIVLTYRRTDISDGPRVLLAKELHHGKEHSLLSRKRTDTPMDLILRSNVVHHTNAQGIYLDGVMANVLYNNTVADTQKEGICLDGGSVANVLHSNKVRHCGGRLGMREDVLKQEVPSQETLNGRPLFVLPCMSLDNALYNLVVKNDLRRCFAGCVKTVRASSFNRVVGNVLEDCTMGKNHLFNFAALEIMSDKTDDHGAADFDDTPSVLNTFAYNSVGGSSRTVYGLAPPSSCNTMLGTHFLASDNFDHSDMRPPMGTISLTDDANPM
eukprot:Rhum_TRINITY_DN14557_c0_g1::Rhum_TRINITY_DN14557_c0_g1_i3::g.94179::m.94179